MSGSRLRRILAIAHESSRRGAGISLHEALRQTEYLAAREGFGATELLPLLRESPNLLDQWVMYSESKRSSGGWYLREETCEVGRVDTDESARFPTLDEAVAQYVIRELDYWSEVGCCPTSG